MKIAVACKGDPTLFSTWSGIPVNIVEYLRKRNHEVVPINLAAPIEPWYYDWKRRLNYRLNKKWFLASVQEFYLKQMGEQLDRQVEAIQPDVVLVIHGDFLAYTTFTQPACFIHDTTFEGLVNYYADFTNLTSKSVVLGNKMYKRSLAKTKAAIFSSGWASNSAITYYGADKSKVFTIPLGANLREVPGECEVSKLILNRKEDEVCRFLFLGIDWLRKGGPDALQFVEKLNSLGVQSKLLIAGCTPQIPAHLENQVELYGFLQKNIPEEKAVLDSLLQKASALILLSHAECYGCVYCEANAYGLPALGRDTGGVSEIIREGKNGLLLKKHQTVEDLATKWKNIWMDKEAYNQLAQQSRQEYITRLNYDVFSEQLESVIQQFIQA